MSSQASSAFELLDSRIQHWIWQQGWSELRDIQEEAIGRILPGREDVVIASATASGKTEAAFLPIASATAAGSHAGLSALCISPLKALINDQRRRLEEIFEPLDLPVHRWHGDVAASRKRRVLDHPSGVLLITPESLEALFVRNGSRMPGLLDGLPYVVIDELHAFIGTERGRQLQSLLHRVELAARKRVARIALSATLGDMDLACEFLRPGDGSAVRRIVSQANRQEVRLQIRGYRMIPPRLGGSDLERAEKEGQEVQVQDVVMGDALEIGQDLFARLRGGRHIVFANRRGDVELYTDLLRRLSDDQGVPNEFYPHHGSLDRLLREEAEEALKTADRPATVLATTTLELGIDVGSVESIAQLGPPSSVASMRQRLGRSGRRGEPAIFRIYIQEPEIAANTAPQDQLRGELVQAIAMVRLLAQRWYEPPASGALHLSTLVQQVLSLLAQHGGVRADQAWRALCQTGPFHDVTAQMFGRFLRDLAAHELITQTADGEIVLGLPGERVVNHYDFYSAFITPEEYRLVTETRTLGTLPVTFPIIAGMHILFGGRRWQVLAVDGERKVVELRAAAGGRVPKFGGGGALVHDRVRQEMRMVYEAVDLPAFVDGAGLELLREGRAAFQRFELGKRSLLDQGRTTLWFPWTGDRAMNTLLLLLVNEGLDVTNEGLAIRLAGATAEETYDLIDDLLARGPPTAEQLAEAVETKRVEKHHVYLGDALLAADYASSHLDLEAAQRAMQQVVTAG